MSTTDTSPIMGEHATTAAAIHDSGPITVPTGLGPTITHKPTPAERATAKVIAQEQAEKADRQSAAAAASDLPPPAYSESGEVGAAHGPAHVPGHIADMGTTEGVAIAGTLETALDTDTNDLGWNEHPDQIPAPLVRRLPNEELWTLMRRFNKQMYHVRAIPDPPPGKLDLVIAKDEEFSPDKLRANLERLYMTVIIGLIGLAKHIARLRSWHEPLRTSLFCLAYFLAWLFNLLIPTLCLLLIVLMIYPPARDVLFPPAPIALVSGKTGNLQTPRAGSLGSGDSLTGAPEKHQGEAVEQEASNFVSGFSSLAVASAVGKHPDGEPSEEEGSDAPLDKKMPDPTDMAATTADAKDAASGEKPGIKHDKTKQPMEVVMWTKARPAMQIIGTVADVWEMLANAMSPTPPFSGTIRYRLAGILAPIAILMALVTNAMIVKGIGFGIGFGFFGQPLTTRGANIAIKFLNEKVPNWPEYLDLRNTLLKGVPTNAQLTLTLLRIGEANKSPLPPPPVSNTPPSTHPSSPVVKHEDLPSDLQNSTHIETNPDPSEAPSELHGTEPQTTVTNKKHGSKIVSVFKSITKGGVNTALGADHFKAVIGSEKAKQRLGILPEDDRLMDGPSVFTARYHGKKGFVVISTSATTPLVSFISEGAKRMATTGQWDPVVAIALNEIREVKKLGGLGWKGKLVVGWATEKEVLDGLEIVDVRGEKTALTAMPRRDELFNRLIALVDHKWESR